MAQLLQNDTDARLLLPGGSRRLTVVLFLGLGTPGREEVLARFDSLPLPRGAHAAVLEIDAAVEAARWFGVTETPALGAVLDGVLLDVEYGCAEGICQRLLEVAERQQRMLLAEAALGGASFRVA
jgi:hypothetical protein